MLSPALVLHCSSQGVSSLQAQQKVSSRISFCFFVLSFSFVPVCSFAEDVIQIYYESDEVVCEDVELQAFVKDIYMYGMRGMKSSGKVRWPGQLCSFPGL